MDSKGIRSYKKQLEDSSSFFWNLKIDEKFRRGLEDFSSPLEIWIRLCFLDRNFQIFFCVHFPETAESNSFFSGFMSIFKDEVELITLKQT